MQDKFYFFFGSKEALPGKGTNEYVSNPDKYIELSKIKNWRHVLSNFYESPLIWNDKTYRTIEHIYQSTKIGLVDEKLANEFIIGGKFDGSGVIARKQRKLAKLSKEQLNEWNSMKHELLEKVTQIKFEQCPLFKEVLLATKDAELWHGAPRILKQRMLFLERIRDQ